jgi:hypothetical protein
MIQLRSESCKVSGIKLVQVEHGVDECLCLTGCYSHALLGLGGGVADLVAVLAPGALVTAIGPDYIGGVLEILLLADGGGGVVFGCLGGDLALGVVVAGWLVDVLLGRRVYQVVHVHHVLVLHRRQAGVHGFGGARVAALLHQFGGLLPELLLRGNFMAIHGEGLHVGGTRVNDGQSSLLQLGLQVLLGERLALFGLIYVDILETGGLVLSHVLRNTGVGLH